MDNNVNLVFTTEQMDVLVCALVSAERVFSARMDDPTYAEYVVRLRAMYDDICDAWLRR